jgi:ribosomal protein S18 acetylase RimI-like enzyme
MIPEGCSDQPFEAEHLGAPVWRLDDPDQAAMAIAAAREGGVGLVYHRGPVGEASWLASIGFRHVETLVTYEGARPVGPVPSAVRVATPSDADVVAEIARRAFSTDRWHADPLIATGKADAFKAAWARNDVLGRADVVYLVEKDGEVAGFNAVLRKDAMAVIDLIAVAAEFRGGGLGSALIAAMAGLTESHVRVGTQATNKASIALYQSVGFREVSRAETWHWVAT